ncbi:hypothetical protein [Saccharothrix obliqua]|uniref:hypothetical protein n=1 Tax=Saccharothrix obliqua TaxID=2861747 RepID=UPI001C5EA016|nr:hypothetical protein [Saccharothrix obliqua]MBW4722387.1 hypothetical protein [Saccharothrix obliqua]
MPTVRPQAKRRREDGQWVYDARIPAEVTLEQAATAMALVEGAPTRARLAADALPRALQGMVRLLLAGETVAPPPSLVEAWCERLVAAGVFPGPGS